MSTSGSGVRGLDHVAVPMQNNAAMMAFYRGLGLDVIETPRACSVHIGSQMINFHRPETWQDPAFTLRAPGTKPPAGDFCVVWEGSEAELRSLLEQVGERLAAFRTVEGVLFRDALPRQAALQPAHFVALPGEGLLVEIDALAVTD